MQVTDQLTTDQAPPAAAAEDLLTALQPAPMQALADQPAVVRQIAPQSGGLLLAAYAALHRAWEQHWSTISEYEEAGSHDQFNHADRPDLLRSWGAQLYYQTPGRYRGQFSTREADRLQATKVAAWGVAMDGCRQALLQLHRAKSAQHGSSTAACTPEQAISQHHPPSALEFRMQTQGIAAAEGVVGVAGVAEKAQVEVERRVRKASCQHHHCTEAQSTMIRSWLDRARQTAEITQTLEQAASESIEVLKGLLCDQSWDHRLVSELHNKILRQIELDPIPTDQTLEQRSRQTKQVESEQKRLQDFMAEVQTNERMNQYEITRQDYKARKMAERFSLSQ